MLSSMDISISDEDIKDTVKLLKKVSKSSWYILATLCIKSSCIESIGGAGQRVEQKQGIK